MTIRQTYNGLVVDSSADATHYLAPPLGIGTKFIVRNARLFLRNSTSEAAITGASAITASLFHGTSTATTSTIGEFTIGTSGSTTAPSDSPAYYAYTPYTTHATLEFDWDIATSTSQHVLKLVLPALDEEGITGTTGTFDLEVEFDEFSNLYTRA